MVRPDKLCLILALGFLTGCSVQNPEELERLVKEDASFSQMIAARNKIRADTKLIKNGLLVKKSALDAQVDRLRRDYDATAKAQNVKIEKYRSVIDTYRKSLAKDNDDATVSLQNKQNELSGYQKTLQDVRKVLHESRGISIPAQEKEKWQERILLLNEKMRPLSEEIQDLKLKVRLNKKKMGFLN